MFCVKFKILCFFFKLRSLLFYSDKRLTIVEHFKFFIILNKNKAKLTAYLRTLLHKFYVTLQEVHSSSNKIFC